MSSSDSLLWLKYSGLPTPEDLEARGVKFYAYKCKKYAYWDTVHSSEDSKMLLLESSASLSAGDRLEGECFEEVQRTWLLMQRWKLDKEHLSIEPHLSDTFIKFQAVLSLGRAKDTFAFAYLLDKNFDISKISELSNEKIWDLFIAAALSELFLSNLSKFGRYSGSISALTAAAESPEEFASSINSVCFNLYDYLGYEFEAGDSDFISTVIIDLGLDIEMPSFSFVRDGRLSASKQDVIVVIQENSKSTLLNFEFSSDCMVLKLNPEHQFYKNNPQLLDTFNPFYVALGKALIDHNVDSDVLTDFVCTLGAKLRMCLPK